MSAWERAIRGRLVVRLSVDIRHRYIMSGDEFIAQGSVGHAHADVITILSRRDGSIFAQTLVSLDDVEIIEFASENDPDSDAP